MIAHQNILDHSHFEEPNVLEPPHTVLVILWGLNCLEEYQIK